MKKTKVVCTMGPNTNDRELLKKLIAQADIDGGLVGGASLKADFGKIVNY